MWEMPARGEPHHHYASALGLLRFAPHSLSGARTALRRDVEDARLEPGELHALCGKQTCSARNPRADKDSRSSQARQLEVIPQRVPESNVCTLCARSSRILCDVLTG